MVHLSTRTIRAFGQERFTAECGEIVGPNSVVNTIGDMHRIEDAGGKVCQECMTKVSAKGPQTGQTGGNCDHCQSTQYPLHGNTAGPVIWFACCKCYGLCEIGESGVCGDIERTRELDAQMDAEALPS